MNTLEYLESEDEEPDDECKWHPDEWGYSDGHDSELVKLSKTLWENHNTLPGEAFFFSAMISAMKQVKDSEISGERTEKSHGSSRYLTMKMLKTSKTRRL